MLRRALRAPRFGALTAMLLAAGLLAAPGAAAAPPRQPQNLQPSGAVASSTPTFSWGRVSGATTYDFQVDDSADFDSPLHTASTANNVYVPTRRLPAGELFWRVRAAASGERSDWATTLVAIDDTAPPSRLSPIDGAELSQPGMPALLQWEPVAGANAYKIEVDEDGDWVNPSAFTAAGPAFQMPKPQEPGGYYWRVRADLGNQIFTQWSDGGGGPDYVVLPLADVEIDPSMVNNGPLEDVVMKWLPVPGATKYEIQVGRNEDFTNVIETRIVISTRYSPAKTYENDQYFWRVRAIDSAGNKMPWPTTQPWSFQRNWPQRPTLVWPLDQLAPAVGDDFYYQWTPVPHATRYQLDIGTDANFSPSTYRTCTTAGTTYTPGFGTSLSCMPKEGERTFWRVRALDYPSSPAVEGIYSEVHEFVYESGAVQQLSPVDGAMVAAPTLTWAPARDAVEYDVQIYDNSGAKVSSGTTRSLNWTPTGTQGLAPAKGPFTWEVQAVDAGGATSPRYAGEVFDLIPPGAAAGPTLVPDEIEDSVRFPVLTWSPHPDAAYYKIRIGVAGSGFWDNEGTSPILSSRYPYPAASDTGEHYLVPDEYMWQVTAYNLENQALDTGPIGSFTILDLPAVTDQRIALDGLALDAATACGLKLGAVPANDQICLDVPATPVLDWGSVPGAGLYVVYLAEDRELTNRVYGNTLMRTSNSRWTPTSPMAVEALADNESGEAYYWYIRPCKTLSVCSADPISTDRAATNAFRKLSPRVELLSPAANSVNECTTPASTVSGSECAGDIAFSWRDYLATNQETTFASGSAPSPQAAMTYRIEISGSSTFATTPLLTAEVDQPTFTAHVSTLPEGDLWWRVQAVDADGNRLAWSTGAKMTKKTPSVDLVSPVDLTTVIGAAPFSWTAAQHASGYWIEIFKNDDPTYSPGNRLVSVGTSLASYVPTKFLSPSPQPYRWRVRWTDASSKPGPWSAGGRFRVESSTVQQTAPAAGSLQPQAGPVFAWTAVAFAEKYRVEVRRKGASSTSINVTTPATSFAATTKLASSGYEWRVVALDTDNGALATSAWRAFVVDATAPTVTKKTPATTAKRTANFVVTFSEPVTGVSSATMRIYVAGRTTPLTARVSVSSSKRSATLNPTKNLAKGKRYTIKLLKGIKDTGGNALAPLSWTVKAK
jgi:hypothetical protein